MISALSGMVVEGPAGRLFWTQHVLGWREPFNIFLRNELSFSLENEQKSSNTFKSVVDAPHLWQADHNGRMFSPEATGRNSLCCHSLCQAQNNAFFKDKFNYTDFLF